MEEQALSNINKLIEREQPKELVFPKGEPAPKPQPVVAVAKPIKVQQRVSQKPTGAYGVLPDDNVCMIGMKKVWPQHLWAGAMLVMYKESRGNPMSHNPAGYYGCFQIDNGPIYDPTANAQAAYNKFLASVARGYSGWRPWPPVKGILW